MVYHIKYLFSVLIIFLTILFYSCKTSGPGLFRKKSPHDQYSERITNAGLKTSALGGLWFRVAEQSIASPLTVIVPYKERGYFSADQPSASGLRFSALRGQKIMIAIERNPTTNFTLYLDLWKFSETKTQLEPVASADTSTYLIQHEVEENSDYILRLQPELLSSGEYTLSVIISPSLAYPIKATGKNHIRSFWGADRDGGTRRHEGIDLFAKFRTPVIAAAIGTITRVDETQIGGKVVWLRPLDKDYTLYYAHLDSQLVKNGQLVQTGDTIGLMGNTGNAQTTSPHLHFGVYTNSGPVDPLHFVIPVENPEKITGSSSLIGKLARTGKTTSIMYDQPGGKMITETKIPNNTVIQVRAATADWYKISLPDGKKGFINNSQVHDIDKSLREYILKGELFLYEKPDSLAPKKTSIPSGKTVNLLGLFEGYSFISTSENIKGWIRK